MTPALTELLARMEEAERCEHDLAEALHSAEHGFRAAWLALQRHYPLVAAGMTEHARSVDARPSLRSALMCLESATLLSLTPVQADLLADARRGIQATLTSLEAGE